MTALSLDVLRTIQEAEQQAETLRTGAYREAREMIKSIEDAIIAQERAAAVEHRSMYQKVMESRQEETAQALLRRGEQLRLDREKTVREAETRLEDAAAYICRSVLQER